MAQPMTATEVNNSWSEYWKNFEARCHEENSEIAPEFFQSLIDRCLRIVLRNEGNSYRKFIFDMRKTKIQ